MLKTIWKHLDRVMSWVETIAVLSLLSLTVGIAFFQVVARWFGGGWIWADELVRYLVLWLGIWGAGPATRHHKHIAIDAFAQLIPAQPRSWIRRAVDLLAAATAFVFVKAIVDYIGFVGEENTATLGVTVGTLTWPICVAFAWIGIRFLADAIFGAEFDPHDEHDASKSPLIDKKEFDEIMTDEAGAEA